MISRPIPVLLVMGLLSMGLVADVSHLMEDPARWLFHGALVLARVAAILAVASRRTLGWILGFGYCLAQTVRYGYEFRDPTFLGMFALLFMIICALLLLHPDSRGDYG